MVRNSVLLRSYLTGTMLRLPWTVTTIRSLGKTRPCRRMLTASTRAPVRLVLFDVFDTLCTPRIAIHEQYYDEAIKGGLSSSDITPTSVRAGFRPAFKELDATFPLYGKLASPPISPEEWWTKIIYQTLLHAGATQSELDVRIAQIAPALLARFESDAGYRNFPETIATREPKKFSLFLSWRIDKSNVDVPKLKFGVVVQALRDLGVKTSIVSNADPRILKTLDALKILPLLSYPPTLSWDVESAKPSPEIYKRACDACNEAVGEGVLMVGDELKADYRGGLAAGIEGRLIRRSGEWSDGAVRQAEEELGDVRVVRSLTEVVEEIKQRNSNNISTPS